MMRTSDLALINKLVNRQKTEGAGWRQSENFESKTGFFPRCHLSSHIMWSLLRKNQ